MNIAQNQPKCYLYTRVSTEMQIEGYSLEAQYEVIKKEAEYRGFKVVHHFSDKGKSGKNITNRADFREMLNAIKENRDGVSYVFVFKLSRFGRNAADVLNSVQFMQDYNVNLFCVQDGIDSASASGKLMISVLSAVAEIERENIKEQTSAGKRQKARDGKWCGGFAPYGYKLVYDDESLDGKRKAGRLEIDEEEAKIVKFIFEKYATGEMGFTAIAKTLTEKGYTKRLRTASSISGFSAHFIKTVIDNPIYMGKIAYGRRITEKIEGTRNEFRVVKNKNYNTYYDGIHDEIVSEELWYKAQEKRKITSKPFNKKHALEHEHILSGIINCPVCGAKMYGTISRMKKKNPGPNGEPQFYKDYFKYVCKHRVLVDGHTCTYRHQPNEDKVNAEVLEIVNEFFIRDVDNDPDAFKLAVEQKALKDSQKDSKDSLLEKQKDLERLQKQYDQKVAAKNKFFERMQNLDICDELYDIKYSDLQEQQDKIYLELLQLEKQINETTDILNASSEERENFVRIRDYILRSMNEGINYWTDHEKKMFLKWFIEDIDIFEDEKEHGRWVKHIKFKMPYAFTADGQDIYDYYLDNYEDSVTHAECVVLMSKVKE